MFALLLLLFMPMAMADIFIQIKPCGTTDPEVVISGEYTRLATRQDLRSSGLSKDYILDHFFYHKLFFMKPKYIHFLDATKYGCKPLMTTIKPVQVTTLSCDTDDVVLASKQIRNNRSFRTIESTSDIAAKTPMISHIKSTWSANTLMPIVRDITVMVPDNTYLHLSRREGKAYTETKTVAKVPAKTEFELSPEQEVDVTISAKRARVTLKVDYDASVTGQVYYEYSPLGLGSPYRRLDIHEKKCFPFSEIIKIDVYYDEFSKIEEVKNPIDPRFR